MKKYKEKSKYVEACQFDGHAKSIIELNIFAGDLVRWTIHGVFFNEIEIEEGW